MCFNHDRAEFHVIVKSRGFDPMRSSVLNRRKESRRKDIVHTAGDIQIEATASFDFFRKSFDQQIKVSENTLFCLDFGSNLEAPEAVVLIERLSK